MPFPCTQLSSLALGVALLLPTAAAAQAPQSIVGVWRFVGETDSTADGKPLAFMPPTGFAGLLIYTKNGHFSAQILPNAPAPDRSVPQLLEFSTAYFGTYVVDYRQHRVTHRVLGNLAPDAPQGEYQRTFEVTGNQLILHGSFPYEGKTAFFAVSWERVE